jgi:hypothetical protein
MWAVRYGTEQKSVGKTEGTERNETELNLGDQATTTISGRFENKPTVRHVPYQTEQVIAISTAKHVPDRKCNVVSQNFPGFKDGQSAVVLSVFTGIIILELTSEKAKSGETPEILYISNI